MNPFFTVIVCTYNRQRLVPRALDSILSQSCDDWEIVVVDDGSTDATLALLERYQGYCPNLSVVSHEQNCGVSVARNTGIKNSNGRYITFLDSDDEYTIDHLDNRKMILQQNPGIQLLHGGLSVVGDPYVVDKDDMTKRIHVGNCAVGGTFFIRNDVFAEIGNFQDLPYAEDADFFERAKEGRLCIHRTNVGSYIYYRNTPNQITAKVSNYQRRLASSGFAEMLAGIQWLLGGSEPKPQ